jgi:hypothetical protein
MISVSSQVMYNSSRRLFARAFSVSATAAAAGASWSAVASSGADAAKPPASWSPARKYRVGVLGATGAVGQRFLQHLEGHPWFEVVAVGASERSVGKTYAAAANWLLSDAPPERFSTQKVVACEPSAMPGVDFVFSALVSACGRRAPRGACARGLLSPAWPKTCRSWCRR